MSFVLNALLVFEMATTIQTPAKTGVSYMKQCISPTVFQKKTNTETGFVLLSQCRVGGIGYLCLSIAFVCASFSFDVALDLLTHYLIRSLLLSFPYHVSSNAEFN